MKRHLSYVVLEGIFGSYIIALAQRALTGAASILQVC